MAHDSWAMSPGRADSGHVRRVGMFTWIVKGGGPASGCSTQVDHGAPSARAHGPRSWIVPQLTPLD